MCRTADFAAVADLSGLPVRHTQHVTRKRVRSMETMFDGACRAGGGGAGAAEAAAPQPELHTAAVMTPTCHKQMQRRPFVFDNVHSSSHTASLIAQTARTTDMYMYKACKTQHEARVDLPQTHHAPRSATSRASRAHAASGSGSGSDSAMTR